MPAPRAQVCPFCQGLNSPGERRCYRCGRPLPGPLASGAIGWVQSTLLGGEAPITRLLLGTCLLVFALCIASDRNFPIWITHTFSLSTMLRFGALFPDIGNAEPWRYLAAVFAHFNLLHVGMNAWSLIAIGPAAERQFGSARYAVLFLSCGVLGFVTSELWYGAAPHLTVGASGAIFGLVGSVIGVAYARRDPNWKQILVQNVVNLAILGFAFPANNAAHVGGLVVGAGLGFLFNKERREFRLGPVFVALAVILLLLTPISILLANRSPLWREVRANELSVEH